jgi:hypothetical protein
MHRASPNSFAEKGAPARRFVVTNDSNQIITYLRIVQVEPKKWRCDVATVKEADEGAGEEDVTAEDELHNDHSIEPAGNVGDDDDEEDEDDDVEDDDDGEEGSEGSWGVPPP